MEYYENLSISHYIHYPYSEFDWNTDIKKHERSLFSTNALRFLNYSRDTVADVLVTYVSFNISYIQWDFT